MTRAFKNHRVAAALAVLGLAGTLAFALLAGADAAPRKGPDQTRLVLRLSDLPLGYLNLELQEEQGDEVYCSALTHPEDTPPKMGRFVDRFHPTGCVAAYSRLFTLPGQDPGPDLLATGAMALGSDRAADAGWAVVPEMLGRLLSKPPREVKARERIGGSTRLFHISSRALKRFGGKETLLVWRAGNTLAVVMVAGDSFAEIDRAAAALAHQQQAHLEKPTRYTRAERFDGEVPLDDPALDLPVYWLGRNFSPGGGLPTNRLFDSYFSGKANPERHDKLIGAEAPGPPLNVRYEEIRLDTWTAANWHVFANSHTAKAITTWKCTQTRTIALPEGSATIYGGYAKDLDRCPKKPPRAFTAWADLGGIKVVVNAPFAPEFIEVVNPYGSFAGMEAILRGLTPRPKRTS